MSADHDETFQGGVPRVVLSRREAARALASAPAVRLLRIGGLGGLSSASKPPSPGWLVEERWERWDDVPPSMSMGPIRIEGADEEARHQAHHTHVVHYLSPVTTVLLVFVTSLFAVRLLRELIAAPRGGGINEMGDADMGQPMAQMPAGMVAVETPGLQPFRPFSGQSYRLQPKERLSSSRGESLGSPLGQRSQASGSAEAGDPPAPGA